MSDQQVFSDRYQLVRHVARGGMAQVYLANDKLLDRPVALKVLFPELSVDPSFVRRFRREAQAAANLAHPNIVSIYDWGQGERTYFIVMEYVDGSTLSSMVRAGVLPAERAASIGADVAAALEFAHRRGVIHRDVKPGNVLIDNSGQVKVTDFGIARAIGSAEGLTQTGAVMGTATYFSPEQAQGLEIDARSDVYSLGVVLYEMVAGQPPFRGENPLSIAYKHVREDPPPLGRSGADIPRAFESIVMKALSKEPSARYQTAGELRADLLRFAGGQAVHAADYTPTVVGAAVGAGDPTVIQRSATTTIPRPRPVTAGGVPRPGVPVGGTGTPGGRPRRTGQLAALLVVLLGLLGVLVFFLARQEGWFGFPTTVTIPSNVVGVPEASARSQLSAAGFSNVSDRTQQSSTVDSGFVITTSPPPGTTTKSNRQVVLIVSSGPPKVAVPDVSRKPASAAEAALRDAGFKVTTISQNSDTVSTGYVITTVPPPGIKVAEGGVIRLVLSAGKQLVVVPTVVDEDPGVAGAALGALGLVVTQSTEPSNSVPSGAVTRTSPPAGSSVPVGSTVTMYVSTGKIQVDVPGLVGDTQGAAGAALQAAGLVPSFTDVPITDPTQDGKVQSTSPAAGTMVDSGTTVSVGVGVYTPATTATTSTTVPSPTSTSSPPVS